MKKLGFIIAVLAIVGFASNSFAVDKKTDKSLSEIMKDSKNARTCAAASTESSSVSESKGELAAQPAEKKASESAHEK